MTAPFSSIRAGFANHEPGGAGGGLADVGQDLIFTGTVIGVPEPTTASLGLLSLGMLVLRRRRAI